MDRYAVIGNPIAHSLSPKIHARFAAQLGDPVEYSALLAPLDGFAAVARAFLEGGGRGANVTLPFKVEAFELADASSERARAAGAANFLALREGRIEADNTDGAGLVADLTRNLGVGLGGARILLVGAGGAARGVVAPLLAERPARLVVANRDLARARDLAARFAAQGPLEACALDAIPEEGFDLTINATSASTQGQALVLPEAAWRGISLAYDMAYGPAAGSFVAAARSRGARASDGLGMLVEQAAESWLLWRGLRPATGEVLAALRAGAA
ncbi:MAG TPA: shikimate dehydrogenase [Usitatibacter sp.]|jgi:shikimate dehydrogenase|nr:shikimate dehydrogenase [Usitatibacter sp.]